MRQLHNAFFNAADVVAIELIRIVFAFAVLTEIYSLRHHILPLQFLAQGIGQGHDIGYLRHLIPFAPLYNQWPNWLLGAYFTTFACAATCLLFGFASKVSLSIVFVAGLLLRTGFQAMSYGADFLFFTIGLLLLIAPLGRHLGCDARRWNNREPTDSEKVRLSAVIRLLQLQVCLIYFLNAWHKMQGPSWRSGEAVWFSLASYDFPLSLETLLLIPTATYILTYYTLALELLYPFAVWIHQKARVGFVGAAILLHLGIGCTMGIWYFSLLMIALNLSFYQHSSIALGSSVALSRSKRPILRESI